MNNKQIRENLGLAPKRQHNGNRYKNEKADCIIFYTCLIVVIIILITYTFF